MGKTQSCSCCDNCCGRGIATEYEKNKDEQSIIEIETNSISKDSKDETLRPDNCFFKRPEKNKYSNNDLYSMQIYEIYLCIHPTLYYLDKINNKIDKSFHPFFYLKLINEDYDDFGVVVQYIVLPKNAKNEQIHLFEDDGVEFIEKPYREFENEIKLIFYRGYKRIIHIDDYSIKYLAQNQFNNMTFGDFLHKAIPEKGIWLQKYLKGLKKNCFEFCINTINKIGVHKKRQRAIGKVKKNIKKIIDDAKDSKHYEKYLQGFENLFNAITGNDN